MNGLPTMLRLEGVPALVVGGGAVGTRRAARMASAGAVVRVVDPAADGVPGVEGVGRIARGFEPGDLAGVRVVVVATADPAVNEAVAAAVGVAARAAAVAEPRGRRARPRGGPGLHGFVQRRAGDRGGGFRRVVRGRGATAGRRAGRAGSTRTAGPCSKPSRRSARW